MVQVLVEESGLERAEESEQVLALVLVPESAGESLVPVVVLATAAGDQARDSALEQESLAEAGDLDWD